MTLLPRRPHVSTGWSTFIPSLPYTALLLPPSLYEDFSTWMQHLSPIITAFSPFSQFRIVRDSLLYCN